MSTSSDAPATGGRAVTQTVPDGPPSVLPQGSDAAPPDAPDADVTDPAADPPGKRKRRRRLSALDKALIALGAVFAVFALVGAIGVQVVTSQVFGDVQRIPDVFGPLAAVVRPEKPAGTEKALNFLVVGADSRSEGQGGEPDPAAAGRQRTTVVMLVHISADKNSASFVSIPHASLVAVPGHGVETLGSAYRTGGGTLLVRTVEQLTALRIDHFAVLDFAGFRDVADALGGVELRLGPEDGGTAGGAKTRLDGAGALAYLRRSDNTPGAALDQVHRQQAVMKALMSQAIARGLFANPAQTLRIADSVARTTSVDDSLSNGDLRSLILSLRSLRPSGISFVTAPVKVERGAVRLNNTGRLWEAVAEDDVGAYVSSQQK